MNKYSTTILISLSIPYMDFIDTVQAFVHNLIIIHKLNQSQPACLFFINKSRILYSKTLNFERPLHHLEIADLLLKCQVAKIRRMSVLSVYLTLQWDIVDVFSSV